MESKGLQQFVKAVFSDERTRVEFTSDPDGVMSRFALSDEEKKAVLSTQTRLGLVASGSRQLEAATGPMGTWFAPVPFSKRLETAVGPMGTWFAPVPFSTVQPR